MSTIDSIVQDLKKNPYVSQDLELKFYDQPFNHVIINNLLKPEFYNKLCDRSPEFISKINRQADNTNKDPSNYSQFICCISEEECVDGYDFFASEQFKDFVSKIFNLKLNQHISYTFHRHKAPSKNGHIHADMNICSVINDSSKKVKIREDCNYSDDSATLQPHSSKTLRAVACLYYFNNIENWQQSNGGGTGVFTDSDFNTLVKQVPPTNNSLFMFEIGPTSFHSFIGADFDRTALVQWFHHNPKAFVDKNMDKLIKFRLQKGMPMFERWKPSEVMWNYFSNNGV